MRMAWMQRGNEDKPEMGQQKRISPTSAAGMTSSWREFFGMAMVELSEHELQLLEREYPLLHAQSGKRVRRAYVRKHVASSIEEEDVNLEEAEGEAEGVVRIARCCDKACLQHMTAHEIQSRHTALQDMTKRDQDITLLALLCVGMSSDVYSTLNRKRTRFVYRFDKQRALCRTAFQYVYLVSEVRLKRLQNLASHHVLCPPAHGNTNRIPANALSPEDVALVEQFIEHYAAIYGLPMPGTLRRGSREILLPADCSYKSVWSQYQAAIAKTDQDGAASHVVQYDSFRQIWKSALAHITFQSGRSDLCDVCEEIRDGLRYAEDHEFPEFMQRYRRHEDQVIAARTEYEQQIDASRHAWQSLLESVRAQTLANLSRHGRVQDQAPCRLDLSMHYSFDFAQQVHYPFSSQQRGSAYFLTPRRCQIFGVCAEAVPRQVFFLTDESETKGKGSTAVIAMIDAFFRLHGLGEKRARLHADNCVGQNKNNFVMWYLMWRVMNGLHEEMTLSFMVPGHTKFSPDSYFGLFKIRYRCSTIDSLADLVDCVANTSSSETLIPQVYGTHLGYSDPDYAYRDWGSYLARFFKPIDRITRYNYFRFDWRQPGWVELRVDPKDEPERQFILRRSRYRFPKPVKYPAVIEPDGLGPERQQYLYTKIRPLVRNPKKRDLTCPRPD